MSREFTQTIAFPVRFFVLTLAIAAMLLNSTAAAAEDPIPFKAMMQSASAPTPVPPKPDAGQSTNNGKITPGGKGEIAGGIALTIIGAGTLGIAALFSAYGGKGDTGRFVAAYAGGAGATVGGITLIILGSNRRSKK
jgi:hypothetical protein